MKTFANLLDTLIKAPNDKKGEIEAFINDAYQQQKVVFALDMSGFTVSVQRDGILAHLCRIRRMQLMTEPILEQWNGELVKYEADNLLAVFDCVSDAVNAAIAMNNAAISEDVEPERKITFSIGIDLGKIILLEEVDCFGDAVNLAHKLGEDLARPKEILITASAYEKLPDPKAFDFQQIAFSVSGISLKAYKISL